MYNEGFKFSERVLRGNRAFTEALINDYNFRNATPASTHTVSAEAFSEESKMVLNGIMRADAIASKYQSFSTTIRNALVVESMYKMLKESMDPEEQNDPTTKSIMRAMVSEYVTENGCFEIMSKMKKATVTTSMIHKAITESATRILEFVDKNDPETFRITPEMRDEFFKQLDYSDSESISDAIHQRVGDAMTSFIDANKKDHEDISNVLQQAQEKIGDTEPENNELRESYTYMANGKANEIRNRPKGVFHAMVHAMCESVMRHKDMHDEFMSEGKLDMPKIVSRTKIMYTFMEMLNTSRLATVDEAFIEGVIADLNK